MNAVVPNSNLDLSKLQAGDTLIITDSVLAEMQSQGARDLMSGMQDFAERLRQAYGCGWEWMRDDAARCFRLRIL